VRIRSPCPSSVVRASSVSLHDMHIPNGLDEGLFQNEPHSWRATSSRQAILRRPRDRYKHASGDHRNVNFRGPGGRYAPRRSERRVRELQTHAVQRSNRIVYKVNKKLCQSERGGSSAMALIRRQGRSSNRQILARNVKHAKLALLYLRNLAQWCARYDYRR
jgi:hypothetical protein